MLPNHISQFIWNITLTSLISKFETTQDDTGENKVCKYYWQQFFPPSLANIFSKKNNWKIKCKKIIYAHLHIYSYKRQTDNGLQEQNIPNSYGSNWSYWDIQMCCVWYQKLYQSMFWGMPNDVSDEVKKKNSKLSSIGTLF